MDIFSLLHTTRLHFRPLQDTDFETIRHYVGDDSCMRYSSSIPLNAFDGGLDGYAKAWIKRQQFRYQHDGVGLWALENPKLGFVGQCGLIWQQIDNRKELEIGYHILREHWGKGFATEAAKSCKAFALSQQLSKRLICIIHTDNHASKRVALKNGMHKRETRTFKGIVVDIFAADLQQK